jgi:predicted DNA-binding helix-hairpin-helix protein
MDTQGKLELLGEAAKFDLCGACGKQAARVRKDGEHWIYPAVTPDGKTVRLLKVLMSNACRNDCAYCFARRSRDFRRGGFEPEELARLFMEMRAAGQVTGLFLSSAVNGTADDVMLRMLTTARSLRRNHGFTGYIHLKVLPGCSYELAEAAARVATRISINLEAPSAQRLRAIAPAKDFDRDLFSRLQWISSLVRRPDVNARSHTTQFVVGAAGESDREIVTRVWDLYRRFNLHRAYYSAYQTPDDESPCAAAPVPLMREHRLYQADWLMRKYGFREEELVYEADGNLSLTEDPKALWAKQHPEAFPVDVNVAPREMLLRVPGIGPTTAKRVCAVRRERGLRTLGDLSRLGAIGRRAAPYVLFSGRRIPVPVQGKFW